MSDMQKAFVGEQARRLARHGNLSSRATRFQPWWPEEICARIDRIVWMASSLNEPGDCWQEFTAYDCNGSLLGTHRVEGC